MRANTITIPRGLLWPADRLATEVGEGDPDELVAVDLSRLAPSVLLDLLDDGSDGDCEGDCAARLTREQMRTILTALARHYLGPRARVRLDCSK